MPCVEDGDNVSVDRRHFVGVAGFEGPVRAAAPVEIAPATFLRPLAEYEAVVGGG